MSRANLWPLVIGVALGAVLTGMVCVDWPRPALAKDARTELRPPSEIGLVDVARVFKSHLKFADRMNKIKLEIEAFENELKGKQAELEKQRAEFDAAASDPTRAASLRAALAAKSADLQTLMSDKRQAFLAQESRIYHATYGEIVAAIERISKERKLRLVLRTSAFEAFDPTDRAAVLQAVNRQVLFEENLDITSEILKIVNGSQ